MADLTKHEQLESVCDCDTKSALVCKEHPDCRPSYCKMRRFDPPIVVSEASLSSKEVSARESREKELTFVVSALATALDLDGDEQHDALCDLREWAKNRLRAQLPVETSVAPRHNVGEEVTILGARPGYKVKRVLIRYELIHPDGSTMSADEQFVRPAVETTERRCCCGERTLEGNAILLETATSFHRADGPCYQKDAPKASANEPEPQGVVYDKLGWVCSVCGAWNHPGNQLCEHHRSTPNGKG